MTLEQLRIFVAVAEREHVTRAAVELGLTQSTVSAAVRALEERHAVRLFDRVGRRVVLTEPGRLFLDEARAVLARAEAAGRRLAEISGRIAGPLEIRASHTIATHWLPQRLVRFRALHPDVEFRLGIANTAAVAAGIDDGLAEIGLVEGEIATPSLKRLTVDHDRLVLVAAPGHRLAGRSFAAPGHGLAGRSFAGSGEIDPADFATFDWVLREGGSGTRSELAAALHRRGVAVERLRVVLELPSNEAILEAVMAGGGVTALSSLVAEPAIAAGALVALGPDLVERAFHLLRHAARTPSRTAAVFHAFLAEDGRAGKP